MSKGKKGRRARRESKETGDKSPDRDPETPEPVTEDKEPVTEDKEPVTEDKEPVTEDKEPATEDKEPVTEDKEPATEDREPATVDRDPELAPAAWQRFDLLLAIGALAILSAGTLSYRSLTAPSLRSLDHAGLHLEYPDGWLPPAEVPPPRSALVALADPESSPESSNREESQSLHVVIGSLRDPDLRVEVRVATKPAFTHLRGALTLRRSATYGGRYRTRDASDASINGRDWLRTRFEYAHPTDFLRPNSAVEYAILNGSLLYVVTFHGAAGEVEKLDQLLAPSLRVNPNAAEAN